MADAGPLAAAVAERDNVAALLARHEQECNPFCRKCESLRAHLDRCRAQVDLLTPPETEAMFDG